MKIFKIWKKWNFFFEKIISYQKVPEINQHHTQLQPANEPEVQPEPEIESLIDISNGLDSLDVNEFHEHSQVEQLQMELAQMRMELEETQQEKQLEVTKLLGKIFKIPKFINKNYFRTHQQNGTRKRKLTAVSFLN